MTVMDFIVHTTHIRIAHSINMVRIEDYLNMTAAYYSEMLICVCQTMQYHSAEDSANFKANNLIFQCQFPGQ